MVFIFGVIHNIFVKKIFINILFLLVIAFIPSSVFAKEWERNSGNPLIFTKNYSNWAEVFPFQTTVLFDDNQYKMWYASYNGSKFKILYAISNNGTDWISFGPVLENQNDVHDPIVIKNDDQFLMWFASSNNGTNYKIFRAVSIDGKNWTIDPASPVLEPQPGTWERQAISAPFVLNKDGEYKMWYSGWNGNIWQIGYATSTDGVNWIKYFSNPVIGVGDGPHVLWSGSEYKIWFQKGTSCGNGIVTMSSIDGINWQDQEQIICPKYWYEQFNIAPTVIQIGNVYKLYYNGLGNDGLWKINLATHEETKIPLIIIPGLFGSWNKDALVYNKQVGFNDWILNPIVSEYKGIEGTLMNLGYQKNQDYYVFNYDWRKSVNDSAEDLKSYLETNVFSNHSSSGVNIVGHSLGGLVGRVYMQKYSDDNVNKLITVGTPHRGAAQAYKAVEAGEIESENSFEWLGKKLLLQLYKDGIKTDKQIINEKIPVVKDLLPIDNFLINESGNIIPISSMNHQNAILLSYETDFADIFPSLKTIVGEKGDTLSGFTVGKQTLFDQLLDYYPDGRPISTLYAPGDYTVTSASAKAGSFSTFNLDHGEVIYKNQAIREILSNLGISYQDSQIVEGRKTEIFPSLVFLILSPATIEVEFNGQIYSENDGLVFIENAQAGDYNLKVKGKELGRYTLLLGQISQAANHWDKLEGEIIQNPSSSQIDTYVVSFNPDSPTSSPVDIASPTSLFKELSLFIADINKNLNLTELQRAISSIDKAEIFYGKEQKNRLKRALLDVHRYLMLSWQKSSISDLNKAKILVALEKLENLYDKSLSNYSTGIFKSRLSKKLKDYQRLIESTSKFLLFKKQRGINVFKNTQILLEIEKRVDLAHKNIERGNYNAVEIYLKSIEHLIKNARRF